MSKRKSPAVYKAHVKELRKYASGFKAAEGFDLRSPKDWTPAQKREVTKYAKVMQALTARENIVFRGRDPERLKRVQRDAGQHPEGVPRFKVAFIPYVQKPNAPRPEIKISKNFVSVSGEHWDRIAMPFDMRKLARDAAGEVKRVHDQAKEAGAKSFTIQAGEFEISRVGYRDLGGLTQEVLRLMLRYDGRHQLPSTSRNRGDRPSAHKYSKWLHGVVAYKFHGRAQPAQLLSAISAAKEKMRLATEQRRGKKKYIERKAGDLYTQAMYDQTGVFRSLRNASDAVKAQYVEYARQEIAEHNAEREAARSRARRAKRKK